MFSSRLLKRRKYKIFGAGSWRLMPIILATWEAEIWRMVVRDQPG
jgi:hypothetical protein